MKTEIQSIHFKADQKLIEYINSKLSKLNTYYDGIVDAQVYLKVQNNRKKENKTVDVKVNVQNQSIFKTQTERTFEAAIDVAVDALKLQVLKYKERLQATS